VDLQLYSPKDVAVIIRRSQKTIYRYIRKYQIPVIVHRGRGGRKEFFIMEKDLRDFIINHFNDFDRLARTLNALIKETSSKDII
jgi:hypothetical protein